MLKKWSDIRILGNNQIVQRSFVYLIIVPILARVLERVQSPLNLTIFNEKVEILFELPFSWQAFFYSALFFTIGSVIYNLRAPKIIRDNKSFRDFENDRKNDSHLHEYIRQDWSVDLIDFYYHWELNDTQNLAFWFSNSKNRSKTTNRLNKNQFRDCLKVIELYISNENFEKKLDLNKISFSRKSAKRKTLRKKIFLMIITLIKLMNFIIIILLIGNLIISILKSLDMSFWTIYNYANIKNRGYIVLSGIFYVLGLLLFLFVFLQSLITVFEFTLRSFGVY